MTWGGRSGHSPGAPTVADTHFLILDAGRPVEAVANVVDGDVVIGPESLRALGWELHDGLLCREALCLPVPEGTRLERDGGIDLVALAALLDRPIALDLEERVAYLGVPAAERRRAMASLEAPDFTLPDLDGRLHSLSEHRGKKILLVAYASW